MDLNQLLSYLEQPIVLYSVVLTIVWVLLLALSGKDYSRQRVIENIFAKKILLIIFLSYIVLIFILDFLNEITLFPILHAVVLGIAMLAIMSLKHDRSVNAVHACLVFSVALAPVIVMVATKYQYPLGDDARFPGFAFAINNDGRWIPNKYFENTYYQFFHLIPFMEYTLASVAGIDLSNVSAYYLILKMCMYSSYILLAYLFTKEITKSPVTSLAAVLLLSITPPLAMTQVVHQAYAIILFLCTGFLLLRKADGRWSANHAFATFPLLAVGVVAHATFTLMLVAFAIPLMLASNDSASKRNISRFLLVLVVASLSYWISIYVLDTLVRPTVDAIDRLIDLLTGRAPPWQGTRQTWYFEATQTVFISWALVPASVASFVLFSLWQFISGKEQSLNNLAVLGGVLGLTGTGLNYLLRTLPTFGGRYFYWLYLLMLPLATILVRRVSSRNVINLTVVAVIIASISYYGVRDPTLSANTYANQIGWADFSSWTRATTLLHKLPPANAYVNMWIDPRLGAPLAGKDVPPLLSEVIPVPNSIHISFAIVGLDNVGLWAIAKDPGNVDFFVRNFGISAQEIAYSVGMFNLVYSSGIYEGIWWAA